MTRTVFEDQTRRELGHLADDQVQALVNVVERLIDAYEPERIYLFGSKARGDLGSDSDFDLLIVVSDEAPKKRT